MGRKGQRKGGEDEGDKPAVVSETTRIRIAKCLEEFRASDSEVYSFEPGLSKFDRAAIHELCRKMGMISKSSGYGERRTLSVFKTKKRQSPSNKKENVKSLQFSEQTRLMLQDLFAQYPPDEGPAEDSLTKMGNERKRQWKQDNSFGKPSLSEEEIKMRLNALSAKVENTPHTKKVAEERSRLPIAAFRDVITSTVESNQVVLLSGETGCGKTTQVASSLPPLLSGTLAGLYSNYFKGKWIF